MTESLRKFYAGKIYPIVVCLLMFISYTASCEAQINLINLALLSVGLLVSDSIRPLIAVFPAYLYQFSAKTAITTPEGLACLLSGERLIMYIVSFTMFIISLVVFFRKNDLASKWELRKLPYPIATVILSLSFLLNGLFSDTMSFANLVYGFVMAVTFFAAFYIFYLGIKNEDWEKLTAYFAYVSALISILIFTEIVYFYVTSYDKLFVDGVILKEELVLGFGISNTVGQCAAVLIPVCFLGVIKQKRSWFYFIAATLGMATVFLSMSRNALLFGSIAYAVCLVLSCVFGKKRKSLALIACTVLVCLAFVYIAFKDTLLIIVNYYVEKGFMDSGRFGLWKYALGEFGESPIFGKGFFGLYTESYHVGWGFPTMMHNTVIQLLSSTGIVGFAAYCYYRLKTLVPFFSRPSLEKTLFGISILIVLFGSLLDNFIFYIPHMLYYPIALAIAFKIHNDCKSFELRKKSKGK